MDYALLLQQLSNSEARIANGVQVIARQREVIAALKDDGHFTHDAESMLARFEEAQARNYAIHEDLTKRLERVAS